MLLSSLQLSTVLNKSPGESDKSGTSSVRDNPGSQSCFFADPKINKGNVIFQYNYFKLYIYRERDRDRDRERETERQRETETERDRDRETEREVHR